MGFCIYCNQKVYSSTTCPKCYRTISVDKPNDQTASKLNSVFFNQKRLNHTTMSTDKWQDTYSKKAIFNTELESPVSPLRTKQHRTIPQFNNPQQQQPTLKTKAKDNNSSNMKSCAVCQKQQSSWTDFSNFTIHNSVFYCKPCLAKKLACPGCEKPVNRTDIQTYFNQQIWHTSCFQCNHCKTPLKAMVASVDTEGKPCCRTCHLKDSGRVVNPSPLPGTPSLSTPILSSPSPKSSQSTITSVSSASNEDNPYFRYQRTRRSSMFSPASTLSRQGLESYKKSMDITSLSLTDAPPTTTSEIDTMAELPNDAPTTKPNKRISSTPDTDIDTVTDADADAATDPADVTAVVTNENVDQNNTSSLELSSDASSPEMKSKKTGKETHRVRRKKKVLKRLCKECGQHVSKRDYRGLRIQTGEVLCFHNYCLHCAKCHEHFDSLEFCTDGKNFYHVECPDKDSKRSISPMPIARRQSSSPSEEDEAFPPTPPPHTAYFDIVPERSIDLLSLEPNYSDDTVGDKKKENEAVLDEPSTITTILCSACSIPVTDTCLELANQFYHKECLLCAGCNKTVPTDRKLVKFQDKLYCDMCTPTKKNLTIKTAVTANKEENDILTKRTSTVTTPSDIFKSRKKVLPRLGGVRTCARCNESMPFSDTHPGPNASRWHKKCLRCATCNKQMDSDAHMTVNEETGLCLVHCRNCLDETPKPRFVH